MEIEKTRHMYNGEGYIKIKQLVERKMLAGKLRKFEVLTLEKNCTIGKHFHVGESELYYCIEGEGSVDDNGNTAIFRKGDAGQCRSGEYHSIRNNAETSMVIFSAIILDKNSNKEDGKPFVSVYDENKI